MTLREFINFANLAELDEDVNVDGIDSIALVGGDIELTEDGEKHFKKALDECYVEEEYLIEWNDDPTSNRDENEGCPDVAWLAWELLTALAGYCSQSDYDKWIKE